MLLSLQMVHKLELRGKGRQLTSKITWRVLWALVSKVSNYTKVQQGAISWFCKIFTYYRPVPTKWETNRKISVPSYNHFHVIQIASFKIMYDMSRLLPHFWSKTHYFLEKFLCFLLISDNFSEPYLLQIPGDLSLIL